MEIARRLKKFLPYPFWPADNQTYILVGRMLRSVLGGFGLLRRRARKLTKAVATITAAAFPKQSGVDTKSFL